jgi:periplasmic divalent cation tolerance protein
MTALVALSTCPDDASAARIARVLVEEGLAACVNRLPGVVSVYRWQGEVHEDGEVLLVIKTTTERFEALRHRLLALHPYQVPELAAWPISLGNGTYLRWLEDSTAAIPGGVDRS